MKRGSVVVSYVHPTEVSSAFHKSLTEMLLWDITHARRIIGGGGRYCSANISGERNQIVVDFLAGQGEWLLMLDADMVFDPRLVDDLVSCADPVKYPIVGGLCFGISDGKLFPTLYGMAKTPTGFETIRYHDYPEDTMFQVAATGAACMLIHRSVLVAVQAKGFSQVFPWYQETEFNGAPCSEDFTFCVRAANCGFGIHVNTGIHVGHHKSIVLTDVMYREQREKASS